MTLLDFYESLKSVISSQGFREDEAKDSHFRVFPLMRDDRYLPSQIRNKAERCELSRYSCQFLGDEIAAAHFLKTCGIKETVRGFIQCHVTAAYCSEAKKQAKVRVSLDFRELWRDFEAATAMKLVQCESSFIFRTRMPCRHIISLAMQMDKSSDFDETVKNAESVEKSVLDLVISVLCHFRWKRDEDVSVNSALSEIMEHDSAPAGSISEEAEE